MSEEPIETSADFLKAVSQRILDQNKRAPSNLWRVYLCYKFIKKGRNLDEVLNDKRWDEINFGRQGRWCKEILKCYGGDVDKASDAIVCIGEFYEKIGCLWDMSSVHKRLTDWEEGRIGRN